MISATSTKKEELAQLSIMASDSKNTTETNSTAEDEFEAFGKHVAVQLKSLPLIMALDVQEHIQLYLNRVRREHLKNTTQ